MNRTIRVLVADDSALFVEVLSAVLDDCADIEICGVASDGAQAVDLCLQLLPDLVTMDVRMPRMDGLDAIEEIMSRRPTPILVMTGDPRGETGELAIEALRRGALDLECKASGWANGEPAAVALCDKMRLLATVPVVHHPSSRVRQRRRSLSARPAVARPGVIGIVASTGGPPALAGLLGRLPPDFPVGIVVVQHLSAGFGDNLVRWLDSVSGPRVRLAIGGEKIEPGTVLIAPDGAHLEVGPGGRVQLVEGPPVDGHRPSATALLQSIARIYGRFGAGLVLTGMGRDGAAGLKAIHDAGGTTAAQDEESSVVWGMPRAAVELGAADRSVALDQVPDWLCQIAGLR